MTTDRPLQLDFVDKAKTETLAWTKTVKIKLHNIETVIPFVLPDKDLSVWLFWQTDNLIEKYNQDGTEENVRQHYLSILMRLKYPKDYLNHVSFFIDSHENVEKNFEGSYFYRLR